MQALTEFLQCDYARKLCDECGVNPVIGAPMEKRVGLMFEYVRLADTTLEMRLHRVFEQRHERLLEHLVKHLRPRMPHLERLLFHAKSPPSTRTIVLRAPSPPS